MLLYRIFSRCTGEQNVYEEEFGQLKEVASEQLLSSAHALITKAFGQEFMQQDKVTNLREIIQNEVIYHHFIIPIRGIRIIPRI